MEKSETSRNQRVVLVAAPFQGHLSPMLQLGALLHSKGFPIVFAHTKYMSPDPAEHPEFSYLTMPDSLSDSSWEPLSLISNLNNSCKETLHKSLVQMMETDDDRIACIIYDTIMYSSAAVADNLKIPSIIFRTSCVLNLLAYHAILRLQAQGCNPMEVIDSALEDLVPELHPLRFKDLPNSGSLKQEDLLELISKLSSFRTSSAIVFNTAYCLEDSAVLQLKQSSKIHVFPVGPLRKMAPASYHSFLKEDNSCITWLNKQASNSVIYVSLGSIASLDAKELTEMAWGLANCSRPFLWVVRPGSANETRWDELLPKNLIEVVGERGCIVKWAPQKEVLAHEAVGGFLSHCGWNSTLESICEGVPILCMPCLFDQKVNARYLTYVWKVGLELEQPLEREDIKRTIERLMVDKEGEEMASRVIQMKDNIEFSTQNGGSSYKSLNDLAEFIGSL